MGSVNIKLFIKEEGQHVGKSLGLIQLGVIRAFEYPVRLLDEYNYQEPLRTHNWGYVVPSSGYLGPNRG